MEADNCVSFLANMRQSLNIQFKFTLLGLQKTYGVSKVIGILHSENRHYALSHILQVFTARLFLVYDRLVVHVLGLH